MGRSSQGREPRALEFSRRQALDTCEGLEVGEEGEENGEARSHRASRAMVRSRLLSTLSNGLTLSIAHVINVLMKKQKAGHGEVLLS